MNIAFIPARGDSKGIEMKNIRLFCGMPLIYWNLVALQESKLIDKIVVASDSNLIFNIVNGFGFRKVSNYNRDPKNARDYSTTESVMLEYLDKKNYKHDDIFMLVQCTNPYLTSEIIDDSLMIFVQYESNSMLSCVIDKGFYWNMKPPEGANYDYNNRPRRQEFGGQFKENGCFYISKIYDIKKSKNRLSGQISFYAMEWYTGTELDNENDWLINEMLFEHFHINKKQNNKKNEK